MKTADQVHELFLNYACSAKCPFCYNPPLTPELLRLDLSYEQAAGSLYKAAKTGARRLNLHGGEVTLRDDLPNILALARKLGFAQITVVTNGIRFSDAGYAESLRAAGATHLRFSIHAAGAEIHDDIVAIPGAFERVLKGIKNVRAAGFPLGINFVIIRKNLAVLPDFLERFCLREGIDDVIVYFPHLRGMMELNADAESVRYEEAAPLIRRSFTLLEAAGKRGSVLLANFVPCVLPELTDRMIDWSHAAGGESAQTHPEGFTEDILAMKDRQRALVAACASCALKSRCLGVEREYAARFGEADFTALKSDPESELCPGTVRGPA
ncbi:MAG: radical SAM protein [Elusimicrobia bacterium]|nr:radical SAM protein [Elusimicrobiota bacterium]